MTDHALATSTARRLIWSLGATVGVAFGAVLYGFSVLITDVGSSSLYLGDCGTWFDASRALGVWAATARAYPKPATAPHRGEAVRGGLGRKRGDAGGTRQRAGSIARHDRR